MKDAKDKQKSYIPEKVAREIINENSVYVYARMLSTADIPKIQKVLKNTQDLGKYPENSWQNVDKQLYFDAWLRHYQEMGHDKESSLPHTWHAKTNIMFLLYFEMKENGEI